jgi:predicted RNase H-like nuclease (RuvC/YqgF family)
LLNVIRMIKSREIIRTDNLTGMGKDGNNWYKILIRIPEEKMPLGNNVKNDL